VPRISDDAVCIRRWEWSETSQTVLLFTRDHGLIRGLAKGARRERAAFSGGFEPLTRGRIHAISKATSSLATLTSWDLEETFPSIRARLDAFHAGMYLAGLVAAALRELDPHPALYDRLVVTLRGLGDPALTGLLLLRFQWSLIAEIGYKPRLDADVHTGEALPSARVLGFDPARGGVTALTRTAGADFWKVRAETIRALRDLDRGTPDARFTHAEPTVARANRLLCSYLSVVLGGEVPGAEFVFRGAAGGRRTRISSSPREPSREEARS